MRYVLWAAGLYNLLWAALLAISPRTWFALAGTALPNDPEPWRLIGMTAGVVGVGYLLAAADPIQRWPLVFVGLLAKIPGPISFWMSASSGRLPWLPGWAILTNDLVWWIPLGVILFRAYQAYLCARRTASPEVERMALHARTQLGRSLHELSRHSPVLLVFLRHFGCTFCREALDDLARQRGLIEDTGTRLTLVHMGTDEEAKRFFRRYGLEDVARVSDPKCTLYRAFGLRRGGVPQLLGPKFWWRGFQAAILEHHGAGRPAGDGFQMPGVFLIFHGETIRSYRHQCAADRPDYLQLAAAGDPVMASGSGRG